MSGMDDEALLFYDPKMAKNVCRRHRPHWDHSDRMYFVTSGLADSIPPVAPNGSWNDAVARACRLILRW